ncbi:hypothetical protein [Streptomyces endophyticus]|uniref:Uncharacterized protein n=1 Tax=Streptomyces endophyticus TaxID=714166 RepID=A0ABU6F223_9ACTN|nr:hypothetical protein [Streptomyces endophyticus]MEB8336961.1 hypothetical protein [Streptomyces endophyticus]
MKIAPFDENAYSMDHPKGTVSFNYLLMGDRTKPLENYRYILGRQEADFLMPRHCHTFEQIRLPLVGNMNLGEQGILREGEVGYFPEGQTYGPQDDKLTDPAQLQLVLQFAGASGLGMGAGRGRGPGNKEAQTEPRRPREQKFPKPRYNGVVITNPSHLNWLPVTGWEGVQRKHVGTYTEREFYVEFTKIDAGAEWVSQSDVARRLTVVLTGTGTVDGTEIGRLGALEVEPGEKARYAATDELVLFTIGLPPVQLPVESDDDKFVTGITDGGIRFEDPKEAGKD